MEGRAPAAGDLQPVYQPHTAPQTKALKYLPLITPVIKKEVKF